MWHDAGAERRHRFRCRQANKQISEAAADDIIMTSTHLCSVHTVRSCRIRIECDVQTEREMRCDQRTEHEIERKKGKRTWAHLRIPLFMIYDLVWHCTPPSVSVGISDYIHSSSSLSSLVSQFGLRSFRIVRIRTVPRLSILIKTTCYCDEMFLGYKWSLSQVQHMRRSLVTVTNEFNDNQTICSR